MKERQIREELIKCRELLSDIFQAGLMVHSDSLMGQLKSEETVMSQYGMEWLAKQLGLLYQQLEGRRHTLGETDDEESVRLLCTIYKYLETGIRQADMDEARERFG
ncbi:MAG: hypothetical protein IJ661_02045 [Lachnospiraceae bacterium]|nr:hypothetical protein [Lachnospiraceae bacterium]